MNKDVEFPELKTFKEEVADIAKSWARQNNCSYLEATQIILRFAQEISSEAYTNFEKALNHRKDD